MPAPPSPDGKHLRAAGGFAYNQNYIQNSLALRFELGDASSLSWLSLSPDHGSIPAGQSNNITLTLDAGQLPAGSYNAILKLLANDQQNLQTNIPILLTVTGGCNYVPGDVNNDGNVSVLDLAFLINYFKGGELLPNNCYCGTHGQIAAASDINGDCRVNLLDALYMVKYFKGGGVPRNCADCPPAGH